MDKVEVGKDGGWRVGVGGGGWGWVGQGKVVVGKWRQLYWNNNKENIKKKCKKRNSNEKI